MLESEGSQNQENNKKRLQEDILSAKLPGEFHTDQSSSSYIRLSRTLNRGAKLYSTEELDAKVVRITSSELFSNVVQLVNSWAEQVTITLSKSYISQSWDSKNYFSSSDLAAGFVHILTHKNIRRARTPKSEKEMLQDTVLKPVKKDTIELAILMFPVRDRNMFKGRGPSPDLGELYSLSVLTGIGRALRNLIHYAQMANNNLDMKLANELSILTNAPVKIVELRNRAKHRYEHNKLRHNEDEKSLLLRNSTEMVYNFLSENNFPVPNKQIIGRFKTLIRELIDKDTLTLDPALLALAYILAKRKINLPIFIEAGRMEPKVRINVIQDAERYACFNTDSKEDIAIYHRAISSWIKILGFDDVLLFKSYKQALETIKTENQEKFRQRHAVYIELLNRKLKSLKDPIRILASISGREAFQDYMVSAFGNTTTFSLFESILLGRHYPQITSFCNSHSLDPESFKSTFLINIYNPNKDSKLEELRLSVLKRTLSATAEYLSSYEANTGLLNRINFDDMSLLIPDRIRLSIHKKPYDTGQFPIQISPSYKKVPWHGTASIEAKHNSQGHAPILSIQLAIEAEERLAVPIVPNGDILGEIGSASLWDGIADESRQRAITQPFFYVSSELISVYGSSVADIFNILHKLKY